MASLFFQTPERSVRSLFHDPPVSYTLPTLIMFVAVYYFIACATYGLAVPSGLFIPCLLLGAAWGRAIGIVLYDYNPLLFPSPGKFALIGAAASLGGIVRMTVSLTVILMEATGSIIIGLPLLATLIIAKYTGDYFNEGIYDLHIDLSGFALLPWEPHPLSVTKRAYDVMASPPCALDVSMRVGDVKDRILRNPHHCYPVVVGDRDELRFQYGTFVGMMSREHIAVLLKNRVFDELDVEEEAAEAERERDQQRKEGEGETEAKPKRKKLSFSDYDVAYPRYYRLEDVFAEMNPEDLDKTIDFTKFMHSAPYCVSETMTMNRVFNLFRLLGLRHLGVVDTSNQIRGLITRKDLRRFVFKKRNDGKISIKEMIFSFKV